MSASKRLYTIRFTLDRLEQGAYTLYDIHWVCHNIDWLYKEGHITKSECHALCDRAIAIMRGK